MFQKTEYVPRGARTVGNELFKFTFAWSPKPIRAHRVLVGSKIGRVQVPHALSPTTRACPACLTNCIGMFLPKVLSVRCASGLLIAQKKLRSKNHKALAMLCPQSVSYMFFVSLRRLRPPNEFSHLFDPDNAFDVRSPRVQRNADGFSHVINVYRRYGKRVGHRVQGRGQSGRERGR